MFFCRGDGDALTENKNWPAKITPESITVDDKGYLNTLQDGWLLTGHILKAAEHLYSFNEETADNTCDATGPENLCARMCGPNVVRIACQAAKFIPSWIAYLVLFAANVVYQIWDHIFEKATLGPAEAIYGYEYSKATYLDTQKHHQWNFDALNEMKESMLLQHTEMK